MLKHSVGRSLRVNRQRGLSIVELLVGVAVGLFLVAGAATLFVTNLGNSRQLLLEARINQDMRAAADLMARDLRRAGYWGNSLAGTVATGASSVTTPNPYRTITPGAEIVEYAFSRDTTENNTLNTNENFGFQRAVVGGVGVVQMKIGNAWQTVTDPQTMDVTALTITPTESPVSVRDACAVACCGDADIAAGTCATRNIAAGEFCPTIRVRQYALALTATAIGNTRVTRTLQTRVRPRNDEFAGVCPA
jgi:prepilin peptidase dependent protein B